MKTVFLTTANAMVMAAIIQLLASYDIKADFGKDDEYGYTIQATASEDEIDGFVMNETPQFKGWLTSVNVF